MLCGRRLYLLKNNGALYAISRTTGRVTGSGGSARWRPPRPPAPTARHVVLLERARCGGGRVVAVAPSAAARAGRKAAQPLGVLAADRPRPPLLRQRGRHRLLAARQRRRDPLAHEGRGRGQGRDRARRDKLYFGDYGGQVHALTPVAARRSGDAAAAAARSGSARQLLLVRRGGVRARLHRQHERRRLLAVERRRQARLESQHRRLRLRLAAVGGGARRQPTVYIGSYDGALRARRAHRPAALGALAGHEDLGAASMIGDLVFVSDLGSTSTWALARAPARRSGGRTAAPSTRRSATGGASTSPPTRRCSRRPEGETVHRSATSRACGEAGGAGSCPTTRGAREGGAPARGAAQARAGDRAPPGANCASFSPHGHRTAASSAKDAAVTMDEARLEGARLDDRAAPQPLPLAHPRGPGCELDRRTAMPAAARCPLASLIAVRAVVEVEAASAASAPACSAVGEVLERARAA